MCIGIHIAPPSTHSTSTLIQQHKQTIGKKQMAYSASHVSDQQQSVLTKLLYDSIKGALSRFQKYTLDEILNYYKVFNSIEWKTSQIKQV